MPWYRIRVDHDVKGVRRVTEQYVWEEKHLSMETRAVRARVAARPLKGTGTMIPVVLQEIPPQVRQYLADKARKQIREAREVLTALDEPVADPRG